MYNLSLSKLGGQCLIAGGIVSFIPYFCKSYLEGRSQIMKMSFHTLPIQQLVVALWEFFMR